MMIRGFKKKKIANEENDGYDNLFPFNTKPHYDVQESN